MLHVLFDYGLNVKLCVGAGIVQTLLWAAWAARRRRPGRGKLLLFLVRAQAQCVTLQLVPQRDNTLDPVPNLSLRHAINPARPCTRT